MMISSAVAHVVALFKNHLPDLNMELLHQDFTVDNAEHETLVSSAINAAQDHHTTLLVLLSLMTTTTPRLCNLLLLHAG
jgi:hypothetical protein